MEDRTSSEVIEFGGDSLRWLRGIRGATLEIAVIALAAGVAIGFASGRLTAPRPHRHHAAKPVLALAALDFTGSRCAVQVGRDLEVGIEIENPSRAPVSIQRISAVFPLGGLKELADGVGPCGALPDLAATAAVLPPGGSEWIRLRLRVRVLCPEALPVGFLVGYATAGKRVITRIDGFPDLDEVAYRNCGHEGQGGSAWTGVP